MILNANATATVLDILLESIHTNEWYTRNARILIYLASVDD